MSDEKLVEDKDENDQKLFPTRLCLKTNKISFKSRPTRARVFIQSESDDKEIEDLED